MNIPRPPAQTTLLAFAVAAAFACSSDTSAATMDWKAYMKASLTPDFHWAVVGAASSERGRTPSSKILDLHAAGLRLALSVETLQFEAGGIAAALPGAYGAGSRTVFSPQAWTPASRHLLSSRFNPTGLPQR